MTVKPFPQAMQFCTSWSSAHFLVKLCDCLIYKHQQQQNRFPRVQVNTVILIVCSVVVFLFPTWSDWFSLPSSCMAAVVSSSFLLSSIALVCSFSISPSPFTHLKHTRHRSFLSSSPEQVLEKDKKVHETQLVFIKQEEKFL